MIENSRRAALGRSKEPTSLERTSAVPGKALGKASATKLDRLSRPKVWRSTEVAVCRMRPLMLALSRPRCCIKRRYSLLLLSSWSCVFACCSDMCANRVSCWKSCMRLSSDISLISGWGSRRRRGPEQHSGCPDIWQATCCGAWGRTGRDASSAV